MIQARNLFYYIFDNIFYLGTLACIFLAVAMTVGGVFLVLGRRHGISARLTRLASVDGNALLPESQAKLVEGESAGWMARIVKPLHTMAAPSEEALRKKIRLKLVQAGLRSNQAYRNFLAAKVAGAIVLPAFYLSWFLFLDFTSSTLLTAVALSACGLMLPNLVVAQLGQKRREKLHKALPDALDMMVICVESGLGLDMTFKRVGEEIRALHPDFSEELSLSNLEIRAGKSREEALKLLAMRTNVPEMQNLVTVLIQTSRFGTSLAKALRVHADGVRIKRRQLAEEQAAKTAVKLVFPLILFIFPAMFIVLVGPAAIRIMQSLLPALGGG
jgi:tight adherence protein C